jgi:transcriptional regulator with XRE-family HTH domain
MSKVFKQKYDSIGAFLKSARLSKGYSQESMAKKCQVKTRKTVENWEGNCTTIKINKFIMFMESCDIDPSKAMTFYNKNIRNV